MLGIAPVLIVNDLFRSIDFYQHKLGFNYPQLIVQPPTAAILDRDGFQISLETTDCEVMISPSGSWDVVLRVSDLWAERAALRQLGVPITTEPRILIDGLRKREVMEVVDLDGYVVCFEQRTWLTDPARRGNG